MDTMNRLMLFGLCALVALSCATAPKGPDYGARMLPGTWIEDIAVESVFEGASMTVPVRVYLPKGYDAKKPVRTLIGLHAHGGTNRDWSRHPAIVQFADKYDIALVFPAMGTTLYESRYYPETTNKWNPMPGGRWMGEVLVPFLRARLGLARERIRTGIFGNATGARGAVLMACRYPAVFGATAGMSGDYDAISMIEDRLFTSVYGDMNKFRQRWENDDNVIKLAANLKGTPVFLTHGEKDRTVPYEQSNILAIRILQLKKELGDYRVEYYLRYYRFHDWGLWAGMIPAMMGFFDKTLAK